MTMLKKWTPSQAPQSMALMVVTRIDNLLYTSSVNKPCRHTLNFVIDHAKRPVFVVQNPRQASPRKLQFAELDCIQHSEESGHE